ncbi:MAG: REDY-like protein HapK [Cyclobacteriaceae bacterium]|nr:REDY-like protein HapK [Cyclobacteriaceae bacterium]
MKTSEILVVLFNLKKEASASDYETYAKDIDSPTIKKLGSNKSFTILKGMQLFGSGAPSPYQYIEIMEVTNFEELATDMKQTHIQEMLNKFMAFAEDPLLIVTQKLV